MDVEIITNKIPDPCGHRVLVEIEEVQERMESGLYRPDVTKDREQHGEVKGRIVAIGPDAWNWTKSGESWAALNDEVLFTRYSGVHFYHVTKKKHFRVMNDEDILLRFRENSHG